MTYYTKFRLIFFSLASFFILIISISSCNFSEKQKGAIIFSFDDQYIDEWYGHRELFKKYNIKATFFVNRPHLLKKAQIEKLKILQQEGHEIGCHGLNHLNVIEYTDSIDVLIKKEIKPAIKYFADMGFTTSSFAHPYGNSNAKIDSALFNYFHYLRQATWNIKDTTIDYYDEIFANSDNYHSINSMGIDTNYRISFENLTSGILRAKERNEVLVLHAHNINSSLKNYTVSAEYLEKCFMICKNQNIKSICVSDLKNYFGKK